MGAWTRSRLRWSPRRPPHRGGDPIAVAPAGSVTEVPRALTGPGSSTTRLSVAANAAATAMFGVGTGRGEIDAQQAEAATTIARRVLEQVDEYDRQRRNETGRCQACGAPDDGSD